MSQFKDAAAQLQSPEADAGGIRFRARRLAGVWKRKPRWSAAEVSIDLLNAVNTVLCCSRSAMMRTLRTNGRSAKKIEHVMKSISQRGKDKLRSCSLSAGGEPGRGGVHVLCRFWN